MWWDIKPNNRYNHVQCVFYLVRSLNLLRCIWFSEVEDECYQQMNVLALWHIVQGVLKWLLIYVAQDMIQLLFIEIRGRSPYFLEKLILNIIIRFKHVFDLQIFHMIIAVSSSASIKINPAHKKLTRSWCNISRGKKRFWYNAILNQM